MTLVLNGLTFTWLIKLSIFCRVNWFLTWPWFIEGMLSNPFCEQLQKRIDWL